MSEVVAQIKVMPEDADVEIGEGEFESILPQEAELLGIKREDVAFGLEAIILKISVPDAEGGTTKIEEAFKEIEGVGEVETQGISRV